MNELENFFTRHFGCSAKSYFGGSSGRLQADIPVARKCYDKRDLADWFVDFARACRASLPS